MRSLLTASYHERLMRGLVPTPPGKSIGVTVAAELMLLGVFAADADHHPVVVDRDALRILPKKEAKVGMSAKEVRLKTTMTTMNE